MNKEQLVDKIAAKAAMTKKQANEALDATLGLIAGELARGGRVVLVGFGTFAVRRARARTGRNPQTGEAVPIPARRRVVFRPGKLLKDGISRKG
ncbi:MAG: HU family DNA-binding protein [candidate division WOR-3 bacterium]